MKHIFIYLFIIAPSCKAQDTINIKRKDIIFFKFNNNDINANTKKNLIIINEEKYFQESMLLKKQSNLLFGARWDVVPTPRYFQFYSKKDTMNIKCYCSWHRNIFFENAYFQKGTYKLLFKFPKFTLKGKDLITDEKFQKIIFKGVYVHKEKQNFEDVLFEDIDFYKIDMKDSINVTLTKIGSEQ